MLPWATQQLPVSPISAIPTLPGPLATHALTTGGVTLLTHPACVMRWRRRRHPAILLCECKDTHGAACRCSAAGDLLLTQLLQQVDLCAAVMAAPTLPAQRRACPLTCRRGAVTCSASLPPAQLI